jgi:hypothetical protein
MNTPSEIAIDVLSLTGSSLDGVNSRGSSLSSTSSSTQNQYVDSLADGSNHLEEVQSVGNSSAGDRAEYEAIMESRQVRTQFLRRSSFSFLSSENLDRHNSLIEGMGRGDSFNEGVSR